MDATNTPTLAKLAKGTRVSDGSQAGTILTGGTHKSKVQWDDGSLTREWNHFLTVSD